MPASSNFHRKLHSAPYKLFRPWSSTWSHIVEVRYIMLLFSYGCLQMTENVCLWVNFSILGNQKWRTGQDLVSMEHIRAFLHASELQALNLNWFVHSCIVSVHKPTLTLHICSPLSVSPPTLSSSSPYSPLPLPLFCFFVGSFLLALLKFECRIVDSPFSLVAQQNSFNPAPGNSEILMIRRLRGEESQDLKFCLLPKKALSVKEADFRYMFKKASKSVYINHCGMSWVPGSYSVNCFSSEDSRKHGRGPLCPWTSKWRK